MKPSITGFLGTYLENQSNKALTSTILPFQALSWDRTINIGSTCGLI